jgi:hypothetical protein
MEKDIVNIGKSVVIKGELNGSEDLTIEGHVEGTIQLKDHVLTIGPNGRIKAQVFAKSVIVLGEVTGRRRQSLPPPPPRLRRARPPALRSAWARNGEPGIEKLGSRSNF